MNYKIRVTKLAVLPEGAELFSARCTNVEIHDDSGGEFVEVSQQFDDGENQTIKIDTDEWPALRKAIERMIGECVKEEGK